MGAAFHLGCPLESTPEVASWWKKHGPHLGLRTLCGGLLRTSNGRARLTMAWELLAVLAALRRLTRSETSKSLALVAWAFQTASV